MDVVRRQARIGSRPAADSERGMQRVEVCTASHAKPC